MLIIPPVQFRKHRGRRVKTPPANQILRVSHDTVSNQLVVIVNGPLVDLVFFQAVQAFSGGVWRNSTGGNFNALPQVIVSFGVNVSAATQWRILDPSLWTFEDGRPLMPPYEGTIT